MVKKNNFGGGNVLVDNKSGPDQLKELVGDFISAGITWFFYLRNEKMVSWIKLVWKKRKEKGER